LKRRTGLKGKEMRRLRVAVSVSAYEKLRGFAPEFGAGAILEHMIERESQKRERRGAQQAIEGSKSAKVTPYGNVA
jgi:hypothetical protein